jgi:hypothetical protein
LRGIRLFNEGYYWEAHEAWESLWHAHGRRGATAQLLQGLIKLAAAGVKAREGRIAGVRTHASRAAALFDRARVADGRFQLGLDLQACALHGQVIAANPPVDHDSAAPVKRMFAFELIPRTLPSQCAAVPNEI